MICIRNKSDIITYIINTEIYEIRGDLNKLELINLYETYKIHLNIFKSSINKYSTDIKIIATQAQDQGGVRKDFMQNAINQLFSTKLFESITSLHYCAFKQFDKINIKFLLNETSAISFIFIKPSIESKQDEIIYVFKKNEISVLILILGW